MKRTTLSLVVLACLVVVLLIVTAFTAASSANAQLGNTGVPVRCSAGVTTTSPTDLTCRSADGQTFTSVPAGYYLMVTDVVLTPVGTPGPSWMNLAQIVSGSPAEAQLDFTTDTVSSFGGHFTVPYFVLPANRLLRAYGIMMPGGGGVNVYVSGLLTTNVYFLPLVSR